MPGEDEPRKLICAKCKREVEVCGFCEREDCSEVVCYRCLRFELRQSRRSLEDRAS